jgi:hypothetical protein
MLTGRLWAVRIPYGYSEVKCVAGKGGEVCIPTVKKQEIKTYNNLVNLAQDAQACLGELIIWRFSLNNLA